MEQNAAIDAFAALAQPTRLAVFRYLVTRAPDSVPALAIAEALAVKPSTLSGHLGILKRADLLRSTRRQREIRYTARIETIGDLAGFLLSDCCGGHFDQCGVDFPIRVKKDTATP
ncbi:helix-turn-helix transcriptional regulator [Cognatishimia sp. F0-27]|uniref:ArsR/SmtB family transcription factor n=1 Tax=Cognatishimia sp. F0-27 TaxID=2816855 RepID=UPI001D0C9F48|nr:helix-turn-helix domain-containing protein [Cognatishimia sp. F0-27]MCC1493892.1 helix-turn-helix transcriptional regulator [Cognatishimia sp. F0-27]